MIYIADNGTLKNKQDLIQSANHLLLIGTFCQQPRFDSQTSNTKIFEIFLNVFSVTISEETKSELLKCIKGIFSDESINNYYNNSNNSSASNSLDSNSLSNSNGVLTSSFSLDSLTGGSTNVGVFNQLEPFKVLFLQFDSLNIGNRRLILEMMEMLLLKNQISVLEIQFYCTLFKSKLPSTLLLVSQHLILLLSKSRISKDVLHEAGLIPILLEFLVDPSTLSFSSILDSCSLELDLCYSLLPGKHFHNNKFLVLYKIVTIILNLMLEYFSSSPQIQRSFVELGGLKALYRLLTDDHLIQPALQVIATLSVGRLRLESKIILDLIEVLQMNGGATTLDSNILTMRKNILATMCYIFHNNHNAKNSFKEAGGFIWCVSILDGISRCVGANSLSSGNGGSPSSSAPRSNYMMSPSKSKASNLNTTNHEIFFFLKVLIDTLSAVMKNNPANQTYFRKEIQFLTLASTLKACGYMEGVYSTSMCDSLLNMAVAGSWPPSCEDHHLEDGSLMSMYAPLTSFFPTNTTLSKNFEINFYSQKHINNTSTIGDQQQQQQQQENNNSSYSSSGNYHPSFTNSQEEPLSPRKSNPNGTSSVDSLSPIKRRGRSYTNDFDPASFPLPQLSLATYSSLDLATELRPSSQVLSTTKLPEKSSLSLAQERFYCCQSCRDSLSIENPEIFKLIIVLMGGTEEEINQVEPKSSCYILRELIFLANASLTNQKKLSSLLIDIIDNFKPLLLTKKKNETVLKLKPLLLEYIKLLAGHNLSLAEFRKYFELLKTKDYPLDLINLLLEVSNRENIPLYYAELSKHGLEFIDFPSWGEKSWPPLKGFGISFWFRYSQPCLNINKSPIFLLSLEGAINTGSTTNNKTFEIQLILDNGILQYRINQTGLPTDQYSFSEFNFEPDIFYHLVITHAGPTTTPSQLGGGNSSSSGNKKTPVKLYVNGCIRGQYMITYPKPQLMNIFIRFGGTNASTFNQDFNANNSWHLGNAYFFEDLPFDKEVFYLYLLGPDHFRGLKVDISLIDSIIPIMDKSTKLHPLLIEHLLNPTVSHLYNLHDKIVSIFSAKSKSHKIANKSEAVTHSSAQPQQSSSVDAITSSSSSIKKSSLSSSIMQERSLLERSSSFGSLSSITSSADLSRSGRSSTFTETSASGIVSSAMMSITCTLVPPQPPTKPARDQQISLLLTGLPIPLPPGVISQIGVKDVIINSGGVSVIIYLMAISTDKDHQRSSLRLLQSTIHNSPQNLKDMREICGYQLASQLICKKNWVLDDGLLSILFSFVGVQSTRTSIHYIDGVVQDVLALKHFLLERNIWRRASVADQRKLFESLEKLVNALHENHEFNITRFRQAGAFETILKMCREDDLPLELVPTLMSILHSIMNKPPNLKKDLQLLLSYLLETTPKSIKKFNTSSSPLHNHSYHHNRKTRKPSTGLLMSAFRLSSSSANDDQPIDQISSPYSLDGNHSSSSSPALSSASSPSESISETIRVSVLQLLLDILSKQSDISIVEEFHSICSLETIFGLLINESLDTRVIFLKIIDTFLHSPTISSQFQKMKGFHLLGHQLQSFTMSEKIFSVLFCILYGKPSNSEILGTSMQMYFLSQMSDSAELKFPGVIITILIILCNCTYYTQHLVIKMIHNIFLQSDQFKTILLDNELIARLIDLLASNAQRRSHAFNSSIHTPPHYQNGLNGHHGGNQTSLAEKEDQWVAEESILALLKEIALYGAKTQEATMLRDILVILHLNNKMEFEYICCLQRRVLFDVISFFNDNNFGSIESLVSSFEKVCVLTINTLCFQERTNINSGSIGSKKSKFNFSPLSANNTVTNTNGTLKKEGGENNNVTITPPSPRMESGNSDSPELNSSSAGERDFSPTDQSNYEDSTTDSDTEKKTQDRFLPIWIREGNLLDLDRFISLLVTVLSNTKLPQNSSTYRNLFSTQYSLRSLLARLVYLLLTSQEFASKNILILQLLIQDGRSSTVLSELLLEEDFVLVLLNITWKFLSGPQHEIQKLTNQLWSMIFKSASQEVLRRAFDCQTWATTDLREIVSKFQVSQAEIEFKKWEEKNNQSRKEWKLQYLEIQKNKQNIIIKNQDITKSTKKLSDSLIQLKTEYEKSNLQYQIENRESKRFFQIQWKLLVKKVTHEKAIWDMTCNREEDTKWMLDPTEGTNRMRLRLKSISRKSYFNIFNNNEHHHQKDSNLSPTSKSSNSTAISSFSSQLSPLLNSTIDYSSFDNLKIGEKVNDVFKCSCITPFHQRDGELLIGDSNVYFLDENLTSKSNNNNKSNNTSSSDNPDQSGAKVINNQTNVVNISKSTSEGKNITWGYEDIIEIHKRRHVLKSSAIEIFLGSGHAHKTYLFAFNKPSDRDIVYDLIMSKPLPNRVDYAAEVNGNILKMSITKKWQRGMISNFEYLMHLNTLAGRSFNDLTQYPIFPFILSNYESEELDLEKPENFRDLSKPMGAQDPTRLKKFIEKYNYLSEMNEKPYHYGSHYSNVGSVLHFLVRLQPFSSYFIEFQGGRFDVPDRAFHSIAQTWRLSSSISSSDVKELIPEFFFIPDFLVNSNHFNMGVKQDGVKVDDVILPPWAHNDPRLFIKRHQEALECRIVSENLHHWIDLMFGYKQQGEQAIKAYNMFFPLTYEGAVDIDSIEDSLTRDATIAQIHSYGQTPKQLFTKPHPKKNWKKFTMLIQDCIYTKPEKLSSYTMWTIKNPVGMIAIPGDTPIPLTPQKVLLYPDNNKFVSWGHWDQNLRINSIDTGKVLSTIEVMNDDIICCDITKNGRLLVTGGTAGTVKVWKRCNNDGTLMTRKERGDNLNLSSTLYGHTDSILCITVSQEFSVIVSGSKDTNCIIWDLNRLTYINCLEHENPVTCVQVSPSSNYIATCETNVTESNHIGNGCLRLWTGNGKLVQKYNYNNDRINCMVFTSADEGVSDNLLITGMESGNIILWNAWNLSKIRTLCSKLPAPITSLAVSKDHTQLISGDANGLLECWSTKSFDGYSLTVGK
eukprot:gene959-1221_t